MTKKNESADNNFFIRVRLPIGYCVNVIVEKEDIQHYKISARALETILK